MGVVHDVEVVVNITCTFFLILGAWFGILSVISQLSVVTNAFLIAVTAQFIPIETYIRGGFRSVQGLFRVLWGNIRGNYV